MRSVTKAVSLPVFIAVAILTVTQPSSATTLPLSITTLSGVTNIGTVTTTQVGANVQVTISLNSGYFLPTDDGFLMFNTTGGLTLTKASLSGFSVSNVSTKLDHASTIGRFTFTNIFSIDTGEGGGKRGHSSKGHDDDDEKGEHWADSDKDHDKDKHHHHGHDRDKDDDDSIVVSNLTFTILNANVGQLTGFGIQFCVADENRCGETGFAETTTPNVPEPGTLALLGTGLVGLASVARRFRMRK